LLAVESGRVDKTNEIERGLESLEVREIEFLSEKMRQKNRGRIQELEIFAEYLADIRYAITRGVWAITEALTIANFQRSGPGIEFFSRQKKETTTSGGAGEEFASSSAIKMVISQAVARQRGEG